MRVELTPAESIRERDDFLYRDDVIAESWLNKTPKWPKWSGKKKRKEEILHILCSSTMMRKTIFFLLGCCCYFSLFRKIEEELNGRGGWGSQLM